MEAVNSVTLSDARRVIAGGEKRAMELALRCNIAVVDLGGNLVAHIRMDGAWLGSIDIAINKAFTARAFDMSTDDLAKFAQPGSFWWALHRARTKCCSSSPIPLTGSLRRKRSDSRFQIQGNARLISFKVTSRGAQ